MGFSESILINFILIIFSSLATWIMIRLKRGTLQDEARKTLQLLEQDLAQERKKFAQELQLHEKEHKNALELQKKTLDQERQKLKSLIEDTEKKKNEVAHSLKKITQNEKELSKELIRARTLSDEAEKKLLERANLTQDEAKRIALEIARKTLNEELQRKIPFLTQEALTSSLERLTPLVTKEHFTYRIVINDYEKIVPKLIGKEGRNIQTFEQAIGGGISITFDQQDRSIAVTSHNSALRQLAIAALESLMLLEKITPPTVIDTIQRTKAAFKESTLEKTRELLQKKIPEALSLAPSIIEHLADLSTRSSFGQNLLFHSIEVGLLMKTIALELQLSPSTKAPLIGLLHDIGKVLSPTWGETHSKAAVHFLEKHGIDESITKPILSHHGEAPKESIEAHLLVIADRISGGLLGARAEPQARNSHHSRILEKIEQHLKNTFPLRSIWASFRNGENHRGGTIEIVATQNPLSQVELQTIEKNLIQEFPSEEFFVTLLPPSA